MALDPADERHQIDEVITRLAADRCGSRQSIAKVVDAAYDRFAGTRIRDYIPLLVERAAARDLRKA